MAIEKVAPGTRREMAPTTGISRFSDMLDRFFEDAFHMRPWGSDGFTPRVDVSETDTHYNYEVALPGMKKEDIHLNVDDNILTISGERTFEDEKKKEGRYHMVENYYGAFERALTLPRNAKLDSINATYEDGILMVSVEKQEKGSGKEIKVK